MSSGAGARPPGLAAIAAPRPSRARKPRPNFWGLWAGGCRGRAAAPPRGVCEGCPARLPPSRRRAAPPATGGGEGKGREGKGALGRAGAACEAAAGSHPGQAVPPTGRPEGSGPGSAGAAGAAEQPAAGSPPTAPFCSCVPPALGSPPGKEPLGASRTPSVPAHPPEGHPPPVVFACQSRRERDFPLLTTAPRCLSVFSAGSSLNWTCRVLIPSQCMRVSLRPGEGFPY